jgi:integrase
VVVEGNRTSASAECPGELARTQDRSNRPSRVRAILTHQAPVTANRVHSITRKLFNWAVENDIITSSPIAGVRLPSQEGSRDRVLSDDELRKIWQAIPEGPFGAILQLAILTGQRRTEISEMEWGEIHSETLTLPKERSKKWPAA